MNGFSSLHPVPAAFYFISVLAITMFSINPLLLFIALVGSFLFYLKMNSKKMQLKEFIFYLFAFLVVSLTNPLFSHKGATPLFFLNGNPITLEALLYGVDIAILFIAVVFWFKCFNLVITDDKLLFLFDKISPKVALLLSSAVRFIPLLKRQAAKIRQSQTAMGMFSSDTWTDKLKSTLKVYSALISWGLENAIDTGSSMKARGYGLGGRKSYSLYTFRKSDAFFMLIIALLDLIIITALYKGCLNFYFYPQITIPSFNAYKVSAVVSFSALCLLPFITQVKEDCKWKYYRLKI